MTWIVKGTYGGQPRYLAQSSAGGAFYISRKREFAFEFKVEGSAHEQARRYTTRNRYMAAELVPRVVEAQMGPGKLHPDALK